VLLPLLVLGALRPDAEDPVLGLVDVPGLFSGAAPRSDYRLGTLAGPEKRRSSAAQG
jgi:hypothetical protein